MSNFLMSIHWMSLRYWWVIPILVLVFSCYLFRYYKMRHALYQISGRWSLLLLHNFRPRRAYIKIFLFGVALVSLGIAVLRPQWRKQEQIVVQEGRDIVIALDVSRSMLATDCSPYRLAVAKKKIKQLLAMLQCERVGLILFSGSAFMQCPLTTDYSAFQMFLDHVDVETISSGSTALDAAIQQALQTFKSMPDRKNKLLVIFTDGEDFSSNLLQVKQEARDVGMQIFTVGVGTAQGAPIPLYDDEGNRIGHQRDSQGNVVITQLNEGILHSLAHDVGGFYLTVTHDNSDLEKLVSHITRLEKERFNDKKIMEYEDTYHYFLLVAFVCLLAEWLL